MCSSDLATSTTTATTATVSSRPRIEATVEPARFPWRFMLVLAALGIAFILVNAALTDPTPEPPVDHMLAIGSCVDIADNGFAVEVLCDGAHDGVIAEVAPPESICPQDSQPYRDRQGIGMVCVRLAR